MRFSSYIQALLVGLLIFCAACSGGTSAQRAFYRWQSYYLSENEEEILHEAGAGKLYLKLFEVTMDEEEGPIPIDKNYGAYSEELLRDIEIVPCVFIENEVIARSSAEELDELADNVVFLIQKFMQEKIKKEESSEVTWTEIQIDCDWMKSSKEKYFAFLKSLRNYSDKKLSCTLRLYPYKFQDEMGVPPVDRAMLLCYNLSNPKTNEHLNTILDMAELKKYIIGAKPYPLPLDIGIPIYSSCYKFTNGQFEEVEHAVPLGLEEACTPSEDGLWFTLKEDTVLGYKYYRKGQRIKIERITKDLLMEACTFIHEEVPLNEGATIAIYHLDESELINFTHETLDSVFRIFD